MNIAIGGELKRGKTPDSCEDIEGNMANYSQKPL